MHPTLGSGSFFVARVLPMGRRWRDDCPMAVSPRPGARSVLLLLSLAICRVSRRICRLVRPPPAQPIARLSSVLSTYSYACAGRVARTTDRRRVGQSAATARHGLVFKIAISISDER